MSWIRAARRAVGLSPLPEFPSLEALMEAEEGQVHNDYRVLSYVVPPILAVGGVAVSVVFAVLKTPLFLLGIVAALALAGVTWFVLDFLDKSIPRSKQRVRKLSNEIWERYRGFANMVGIQPAMSPAVGEVLNEAASIYLKHSTEREPSQKMFNESHTKAILALEEAMGKLLELATPTTVAAQDLALSAGWALPLLLEMREMDRALDQHMQTALATENALGNDPLAGLREARHELQRIDTAMEELDQRS